MSLVKRFIELINKKDGVILKNENELEYYLRKHPTEELYKHYLCAYVKQKEAINIARQNINNSFRCTSNYVKRPAKMNLGDIITIKEVNGVNTKVINQYNFEFNVYTVRLGEILIDYPSIQEMEEIR